MLQNLKLDLGAAFSLTEITERDLVVTLFFGKREDETSCVIILLCVLGHVTAVCKASR